MGQMFEEADERRQSLRVDLEAERVLLGWVDSTGVKQTDQGICIDLSRKGILIEYREAFKLGELIDITFNADNDKITHIKGQVCRVIFCHENSHHIALQLI